MSKVVTIGEGKKKVDVLEVKIGATGESFGIPLASSLSVKEASRLTTRQGTMDFMLEQIPEKYQDMISFADLKEIANAWVEASKQEGNTTVGES